MTEWQSRPDPAAMRQMPLPGLLRPPQRRVLATPAEQALERARTRLVFFALLFVLVFVIIGGRLTFLTLFNQPGAVESEATDDAEPTPTLGGMGRAQIVDRNGVILAASLPTTSACANVRHFTTPNMATSAALAIVGVLPELDAAKLADNFVKRKGCVAIKRHLTPKQYAALNALGIGAIEFSADEQRRYPQGALFSHILGTTDIDNIGTNGLEKKLDTRLRTASAPLPLTLDVRVQHILHHELSNAVKDFSAIGGAGVVMDVQTGAIIALVSLPDFEPEAIGTAPPEARFNRATLGVYELGSTFKLFTAAQALELGTITMTETINTVDPIHIGRHTIRDYHPEHHRLTLPEIIMVSSNIGAARIAEKIGATRQKQFLDSLGMFKPPPIELPEVGRPLIPDNWGDVATMTIGFGHGIAAAPLQLVRGVATLSNGGYLIKPTLLQDEAKAPAPDLKPLLSKATTAKMRAMMRLVVMAGTAKTANIPGYLVGGKTGTAEKIAHKHYDKNARLSSFIGVFPLSAPRYVVFAMLDEPRGNKKTYGFATGGWVAAPLVGRVISASAPLLGVPPMDSIGAAAADSQVLQPLGSNLINTLVKPHEPPEPVEEPEELPSATVTEDH